MGRRTRNRKWRGEQKHSIKLHKREMGKSEMLYDLRASEEKLQRGQESLLNSLVEMDRKRIRTSKSKLSYTGTLELFYDALLGMMRNDIRENTIDDFFKGWTANVRYLSQVSTRTDGTARKHLPYIKRGHILKVNFGWNVGTELRYEHYAIVVEKLKHRNPDNVMVVPLVSFKDIHRDEIEEPDVYLGAIRALNRGKSGWEQIESIARVSQMRTIDKLRIISPKRTQDLIKVDEYQLDMIDGMISKWFIRKAQGACLSAKGKCSDR